MENKPQASDEIDLTQFFKWIGRGFRNFGNGILAALAGLRNLFFSNLKFFILIIGLGLGLGVLYSELFAKKFYKTTMVLSCDYLNRQIMENAIEKLNLLTREREREGLSEILNIDTETALNIMGFEFKPFVSEKDVVELEVLKEQLNNVAAEKKDIVQKVIKKIEIQNKNAYEIAVHVYNPDIVKPLEKALINYFKSNEYIKRRIEINHSNLVVRKTKLQQESKKLDSLKRVLFENFQSLAKQSRGSNNVILGDERLANPLEIFQQDLQLNREILDIEKDLYVQPDFEVVAGFTTFKQPESASLLKILVIAFLISWVFGYVLIGAWRFDRYLANYPNQPKAA
jgi:hypothetical protein